MMSIRGYDLTRAQLGWICDTCFTVSTVQQFSAEERVVRSQSRWFLLAILKGYFTAKRKAAELGAKPGERARKGWAD